MNKTKKTKTISEYVLSLKHIYRLFPVFCHDTFVTSQYQL